MLPMATTKETDLLEGALAILGERLPPGWTVERSGGQGAGEGEGDTLFVFSTRSGMSMGFALVEARRDFVPADVERLLGGLTRRLRDASSHRPILLVSGFLSPRTRELLAAEDINYLDLTGNVRLVMQMPPIFVETSGADRQPRQRSRKRSAGLSGAKAGQVIRFLAEVEPPYGVNDLERATGVSRGYISRVLDRLVDEALIERKPRGPVEGVDWPALLRLRGELVDLFAVNTARTYVSPNGARAAIDSIRQSQIADRVVVTGSFAAVAVAPVAAPALLVLYLKPQGGRSFFDSIADGLGLFPADESPDVVLLEPDSDKIIENPRTVDGLAMVNLPQLVVDCLGGTGRMPSEGEAVLEWMQANEGEWRERSRGSYGVDLGS